MRTHHFALVLAAGALVAPLALSRPGAEGLVVIDRPTLKESRRQPLGDPNAVVFYLTVLHNNDGESQIVNAGAGDLANFGGIARFKTVVDNLRAAAQVFPPATAERASVLISSGDNFLAGPEFNASLNAGVPFFDSIGMSLIGYDAAAIGNHEFDFGPDVLADFIAGFSTDVPFLSANLDFTNEPNMLALVNQGRVARSAVIQAGSRQIGIVGATTPDLPFISSPRDTIIDPNLTAAVQAEVDALTANGVDIIILTSHLQGLSAEFDLIPTLRDVDIVIGGGGGELLANPTNVLVPGDAPWPTNLGGTGYPRIAPDADANPIPVVTTKGDYRYVGRLIVGFNAAGEVVEVLPESGPVRVSGVGADAVASDPDVQSQVVDPVAAAVATLAANTIGVSLVDLDGVTANVRSFETNLGNVIADSTLYAGRTVGPGFGVERPLIAFQNAGGIRNNSVIPAGLVSELDTFSILPFANFVCVIEDVTPERLKSVLENAVSRVNASGNGRFAQIAGFRLVWDFSGVAQVADVTGFVTTPGSRVKQVILDDGTVIVHNGQIVPGAPTVDLATIDFLARGGDQYPLTGLPFTTLGVTYQQALRNYITNALNGLILPTDYRQGGEGRIIRRN